MTEKLISCSCNSPEHILVFNLNKEDKEIYTSVFLHQYRSFYERTLVAVKYVFGYKSKYGHWDCFSADAGKILELKEFFDNAAKMVEKE
jgi:hypothetical protein